jgi:catechol 2,3-dioxygenase-like lactoylglutathione lyase family enzyme
MTNTPPLTPELDVDDLSASLRVYIDAFGFKVLFERPEERFACLELEGAHLMLEEASGPGRRFRTAPLERPYGRGVNLQIRVSDVVALYDRATRAGVSPIVPLEERWYRQGDVERGNRQFVAADPDGYLLRFFSDLGAKST